MLQIFGRKRRTAKDDIERKIDDIIQSLDKSDIAGAEIHELKQYFTDALQQNPAYRSHLAKQVIKNDQVRQEIDIVFARARKKSRGFMSVIKNSPNPIHIVISLLIITLGFAMIILPAPPYFEMYTIFYFNENDGFTLMDLISLLIVFCGIFALIIAVQPHKTE